MKTEAEIKAKVEKIEKDFDHILTGSRATMEVNQPRAVQQIAVESQLAILHWVLGTVYKSKLRRVNR